LLGALFAWTGLFVRNWKREEVWKELWWLASGVAVIGVVALSGWQNTNVDRYLVWLLPVWFVYMAEGVVWMAHRLSGRGCRALPFLAVAAFQAMGSAWLVSAYYGPSLNLQQQYDFEKEVQALIPEAASLGTEDPSIAYAFPGHRMVHLVGIYTPDLLAAHPVFNLERLKYRPDLRFDYWWFSSEAATVAGSKVGALCGEVVALGMDKSNIRKTCWSELDRARAPVSEGVLKETSGWRLADRLDVGYPEDEARCDYAVFSRFHRTRYTPFGLSGRVGTNALFEVGRMVVGCDSMTVRLRPQAPVRVVLRTLAKAEANAQTANTQSRREITFGSPLKLRIHVDGSEAGVFNLPISTNTATFSEVVFTLASDAVKKPESRLTVYGDHIALAYWFFQPAP